MHLAAFDLSDLLHVPTIGLSLPLLVGLLFAKDWWVPLRLPFLRFDLRETDAELSEGHVDLE